MVITLVSYAQTYKMYSTRNYHNQLRLNTMTGEVQQIQDDGQSWEICSAREASGDKVGRFCLYETQNMWTFIMLDTYTGKNWQVQFSVKGEDYMFAAPINIFSLAYPETTSNWSNRFQMFRTQNMWTFILLDSYNGRLWQVQYSTQDLDNLYILFETKVGVADVVMRRFDISSKEYANLNAQILDRGTYLSLIHI